MAAREIVSFLVGMGGNLQQQATSAAAALDRLGASAKTAANAILTDLGKAAKSQNQNQLLSQFESLSSLLIQVGGGFSQLGIAMSTAARPAYLLASQVGAANLALAATPALGLAAAAGIRAITNAGEDAIETLTKMGRIDLISQEQLSNLKDYRRVADDLTATLEALKAEAGSRTAPAATEAAGTLKALLSGDRAAWEPLLWSYTMGPMGGLFQEKTLEVGQATANEAITKAKDRANFDYTTGMWQDQAAYEEKLRKESADRAPAAVNRAISEREALENKRIAAAKRMLAEQEKLRDEYIRANEGALKDFRAREADLDKIAMDEAMDTLRADQQRFEEQDRLLKMQAMDALRNSQDYDNEQARIAEQDARDLAAYESKAAAAQAQGVSATASAFTGGDVGSIVSTAGGGPWGAIFGSVASGDAFDMLEGLFDQVLEIYTDLPEQIGKLASELVPSLIRAAPDMAAAFLVLGPSTVSELIKAAPEIFESVVDALLDLPRAFAEAIGDMFRLFGETADTVGADGEGRRATRGGISRSGAIQGSPASGDAWPPPPPRGGRNSRSRTGGGGSINIGQIVAPNARDMVRQLRQIQGPYGLNEDAGSDF